MEAVYELCESCNDAERILENDAQWAEVESDEEYSQLEMELVATYDLIATERALSNVVYMYGTSNDAGTILKAVHCALKR